MDGVLNLIKPPGMTSHDVVNVVRRALGQKKVGHTGTLDPGVAGVLPICVGKATRLAEFITSENKAYRAEITLGITTDTQDSFGQVISTKTAAHFTRGDMAYALTKFQGEIMQTPPMVSAVKVGGKRLYNLARVGIEVERSARPITIHHLRMFDFRPGEHPQLWIDVECSKGTYIRTLAHDIGQALGVGAHMSYLVRTKSGPFTLATANTLEQLMAGLATLLPPIAAIGHMPQAQVSRLEADRLRDGVVPAIRLEHSDGTTVALVDAKGDLLALAEAMSGAPKLLKVFS